MSILQKRLTSAFCIKSNLVQSCLYSFYAFGDLFIGDDKSRFETQTLTIKKVCSRDYSLREARNQSLLPIDIFSQLYTVEQSYAFYLLNQRVGKLVAVSCAFSFHICHELVLNYAVESCKGGNATKRVSAKSGGMTYQWVMIVEALHDVISSDESSYRHSASHTFCNAENVRHNALKVFKSEEFARSSETCLNFIED